MVPTKTTHGKNFSGVGTVTYKPSVGFTGTDYFTYMPSDNSVFALDSFKLKVTATLALSTVTTSFTPLYNTAVTGTLPTASGGTPATTGNSYTYSFLNPSNTILTPGSDNSYALPHGSLSVNGSTFTYTPTTGYHGSDSFTYQAADSANVKKFTTFNFTVGNPTLSFSGTDSFSTAYNTALSAQTFPTASGENPSYSYAKATHPIHGVLTISGNNFTYTPTTDYSGIDSFTYTVTDSSTPTSAQSSPQTVNLTIAEKGDLLGSILTLTESNYSDFTKITNSRETLSTLTVDLENRDETKSDVISNNIKLVKTGSHTLTLTGTNTYTNGTTITEGAIAISSDNNLGMGDLTLDGGALQLLAISGEQFSFEHNINLTADSVIDTGGLALILAGNVTGNFGLSIVGGGSVIFGEGCTYTGHTLFDTATQLIGSLPLSSSSYPMFNIDSGQTYIKQGQLTGPSALVKDGEGECFLQNQDTNLENNYKGGTLIRDGILTVNDNAQLPTSEDAVTTITFDAIHALSNKGSDAHDGNPVLKSGGANLSSLTNAIVLNSQGAIDTQENSLSLNGSMSGPGDFYKIGDNELTLANSTPSTQSGATYVNGGSLAVSDNGNLGQTSSINLQSGALHVLKTVTSIKAIHLGGKNLS